MTEVITSETRPAEPDAAEENTIHPFHIDVPEDELVDLRRRIAATRWPDKETVADQSQGVQLATIQMLAHYWATEYDWRKMRVEAECPAAVHYRDRWAGHSLHSRSFEARGRVAAHRQPRVARLDHRAAEDHRSADRSHGARRRRRGRVPRGDSVDAGLWVLGQADEHRLGPRAHGSRLGSADAATGLQPLCRPGRRLGRVRRRPDGRAGTCRIARHPHQHACDRSS